MANWFPNRKSDNQFIVKWIKFIPGIAWFLFVMVLICLPGEDVPKAGWLDGIANFDKLVHAGLFGGIVFWFCMPFRKTAMTRKQTINLFIRITIATVVWGFATELIQLFFIPNRQYDLTDWLADSIGAVISFFVCKKFFLPKSSGNQAA